MAMVFNRFGLVLFLSVCTIGCTDIEGGECDEESTDRQWYFITQTGATSTLKKCVMCNFSLEPSGYEAWIMENAGEAYLSDEPAFDDVLPCVYVYGPGPYENQVQCKSLACGRSPETNDAVEAEHHAGRTILQARAESD